MKNNHEKTSKYLLLLLLGLCLWAVASVAFASNQPPLPPPTPVPLMGEEILIPTLVGYGIYRLRKKNK